MRATVGLAAASALPLRAQAPGPAGPSRQPIVAQIVDTSATQVDVAKDFLVGSRAAWKDINARGGIRGKLVQHLVLEVDGSAPSLQDAFATLKRLPQCLALFGTAADPAASQVARLLQRELPDTPHVAPWLQNPDGVPDDSHTFALFASRREQIAHAVRSLSVMGVSELGAVYGSPVEFDAYRSDMERVAAALRMTLKSYRPASSLPQLGQTLPSDSPRILIFLGGTPELVQFTQGLEKQAAQRYVIAMSDVNLQTLLQMGLSRRTPVIATQVVPLVNANLPIVKAYRDTLGRLYDEPPTPQSLAGFLAARYTFEMLHSMDAPLTRANALQAFQQRGTLDLGGFRIALESRKRSGTYVTQSMVSPDGRLVG